MRVIPVLDLKDGVVVRAVGGRRDEYRPVAGTLTPSAEPLDVARAFRDRLGLTELYVADLDAIAGQPPRMAIFRTLHAEGFSLWVDAGLRHAEQAPPLIDAGVSLLVAGLETLAGPEELARLCSGWGDQIVFSLDLKDGHPLIGLGPWPTGAWEIAEEAVQLGVRRLLVLDLAQVGKGRGTGTEELCRRLTEVYPGLEVCAGGGVRGPEDLDRLSRCGVSAVLAASALHDERLRREDLAPVQGRHS